MILEKKKIKLSLKSVKKVSLGIKEELRCNYSNGFEESYDLIFNKLSEIPEDIEITLKVKTKKVKK